MTDMTSVELVLDERPAWPEVGGVLLICLFAFLALVHFDGAAARSEAQRARAALDKRAGEVVPAKPSERRRAGDDSISDAGPISLPVGSAWGPGTSTAVGHAKVAPRGAAAEPALRRIVGPVSAPVRALAPAPAAASDPPLSTALLALFAGIGVMMALAGSALLVRSSR